MNTIAATTTSATPTPPVAFTVAVWLGMTRDDILQGLAAGTIAPPAGAAPGWTPPQWSPARAITEMTAVAAASSPPVVVDDVASPIVDRERIERWLVAIDPALDGTSFDTLWQSAGIDDAARASRLFGTLCRRLPTPLAGERDESALAAALDAFVADPAHRAGVVPLAAQDGAALAALARSDAGAREALIHADAFALTGNQTLFAGTDSDRFDRNTGERLLADAWIDDRAKYVAWLHASSAEREAATASDASWTFIDRTRSEAGGQPATLVLGGTGSPEARHQVIFGTGRDDVVTGGRGTDRIHGDAGNDVLRGGDAADLLDGGRGDDLLLGGGGNDDLDGGAGNDELEGGRGTDHLDGGGGDDTLTGGRGDDLLLGGHGHDTYVLDNGDGHDTIVDADGDGVLQVDGETLGGQALAGAGGTWSIADGRWTISLDGSVSDGGTLTLRDAGSGGDGDAAGAQVIQVRGWHNGELGITLGAGADGAEGNDPGARLAGGSFDVALPSFALDRYDGGDDDAPVADGPGGDTPTGPGDDAGATALADAWEALYAGSAAGDGAAAAAKSLLDLAAVDRALADFDPVPAPLARNAWARAADAWSSSWDPGPFDALDDIGGAGDGGGASAAISFDQGATATNVSTWNSLEGDSGLAPAVSWTGASSSAAAWCPVPLPPARLR